MVLKVDTSFEDEAMNTYIINLTLKVVYEDGHNEFVEVKGKASGETELVAADKCFKKNKRSYDNVSSVVDVTMFEFEATDVTKSNNQGVDDDSAPKKEMGAVGAFVLKTLSVFRNWVWVDAIVISSVYGLWYALHVQKGAPVSENALSNVITTAVVAFAIAIGFSVFASLIGANNASRKQMGRFMSLLAIIAGTAVNVFVCHEFINIIS